MVSYSPSAKQILVAILLAAATGAFGQAETQNPAFPFWKLKGNTNTDTAQHFVGTTDAKDLTFRTNNIRRVTVDINGNVGIGTISPLQKFHVGGLSSGVRIGGLATGGSFIAAASATTDKLLYADQNGDIKAMPQGNNGDILTINGSGVPAWSSSSGTDWSINGNSGTNAATNFLGTTDAADLTIKIENVRAGFIERSSQFSNTFLGYKAGITLAGGSSNALFGTRTAEGFDGGNRNSMFGSQAGGAIFGITQNDNTLIGYRAGYNIETNNITAVGSQAGQANRDGLFNTYLGFRAGYTNASGQSNIFVGDSAGLSLNGGGVNDYQNVFVGSKAGLYQQSGANNTLMGYMTGIYLSGSSNTLVGSQAASGIFSLPALNGITALGYQAGFYSMTDKNTFAGYRAGYNNNSATSVTAIGYEAGVNAEGSNTVLLGDSAGYNVSGASYQNTFLGSKAAGKLGQSQNSVAVGYLALSTYFNPGGQVNNAVAIGTEAGQEANAADNSIFIGYRSGYNGFSSSENVLVGVQTAAFNNALNKNVFVGNLIAQNSSTSSNNVILGYKAANQLTNSSNNVLIGYSSGLNFNTGNKNVLIGANQPDIGFASQSIAIGETADPGNSGTNNTVIGEGASATSGLTNATALGAFSVVNQNNALILGNNADVGINTSTPARKLHVAGLTTGVRFGGLSTGGSFVAAPAATTDKIMYADLNGDLRAMSGGSTGQLLTYTASGPAWSTAAVTAWNLTGNTGTVAGTNFIGTTDAVDFVVRTNSSERMRVLSGGNVGIGVTGPVAYLDVAGNNGGTVSLQLRSGNNSAGFASNQITFSYNGGALYRHAINSRHNSGTGAGNAIDFYLWNQGTDANSTIGTKQVMTIDGNSRGMVGIGTTTPKSELHITDGSASLKAANDGGGYGASILITDNVIPRIYFEAATQPADKKLMGITLLGQNLSIGSLTDNAFSFDQQYILSANRDGNVGIGIATGLQKLHVNGSTSGVRIGGLATGGSFITTPSVTTDKIMYADANGDLRAIANGSANQVLSINGSGVPAWAAAAGANSWSRSGNSATVDGTDFLGTTDNIPFTIRVNNQTSARLDPLLSNAFFGYWAGRDITTGTQNIAVGTNALLKNQDGRQNAALGTGALGENIAGNGNTAVGNFSLSLTTGSYNTASGADAMATNVTGSYNSVFGNNSDVGSSSSINASAIGYNAVASGNDYVRIGNTAVTSIFGAVSFNTSDGRFKTNVKENVPGLAFILNLRPVTYHFEKQLYSNHIGERQEKGYTAILAKQDAENKLSTGFIAQEVEHLADSLHYDFDGLYKPSGAKDAYGLGYQQFVTPLVKAVQEQQMMIDKIIAQNKAQQQQIEELTRQNTLLQQAIGSVK